MVARRPWSSTFRRWKRPDLVVPANAQTYVYAFADPDGNGIIQQTGEPIGFLNGGNVMGTGLHSVSNQNISMFFGN